MSQKVLENGLVVLAERMPVEDLVAVDVKILSGSSREGRWLGSGISHLVEHMLFKGTGARGPGEIEREVKSLGGTMNGSVSHDLTDYHITLPARHLERALAILKDMLADASFDEREMERERVVILKEARLSDDEPMGRLVKTLFATAYRTHPYRHPIIGHETLLAALTREDIVRYYEKAYTPDRVAVAVVGDIDPARAIAAVEKEFGDFRAPRYDTRALPAEPPQIDERVHADEREVALGYLAMGFHSTALDDADLYALDVLAAILGRGETSRLTATIRDKQALAHMLTAWNYTPRDPGLFAITAIVDPAKAGAAQAAIIAEVDRIAANGAGDDELARARNTIRADLLRLRETVNGRADDLASNYLLTGSPAFSERYLRGIEAVTDSDIRRVARDYLNADNRTIVRLMPRGEPAAGTAEGYRTGGEPRGRPSFTRAQLDTGLRILLHERRTVPMVSLTAAARGGLMVEDERSNGIAHLVSRMLFKGTRTRTEKDILGSLERRGATIDPFSGTSTMGFTITFLAEDLDTVLAITADLLSEATFPDSALAREKELTVARIREEDDDIFERGFNALRSRVFEGSPQGLRPLGEPDTVMSLTRNELLEFYRAYYTAGNIVIGISGDIDAASLAPRLRQLFSGLRRSAGPVAGSAPLGVPPAATTDITMPKDQSLVLAGYRSVPLDDPDRYPLEVAGSVLSGQSGRLFTELRDTLSLAYALGCLQRNYLHTGLFAFYVATSPEATVETRRALDEQVAAITGRRVSDEDVALARRELITQSHMNLQSNAFIATRGAMEELCGRGGDAVFSYDQAVAAVTADDILRVTQRYLTPATRQEVVITPLEKP